MKSEMIMRFAEGNFEHIKIETIIFSPQHPELGVAVLSKESARYLFYIYWNLCIILQCRTHSHIETKKAPIRNRSYFLNKSKILREFFLILLYAAFLGFRIQPAPFFP